MKKFSRHYSWHGNEALTFASHMVQELKGLNNLDVFNWLDYDDIDWVKKCSNPCRRTLLHEYISYIVCFQYQYSLDKHFPMSVINPLSELMKRYGIDYSHLGNADFIGLEDDELDPDEFDSYEVEKYGYKIYELFDTELEATFVDDIFTVLFANKEFLFEFNSQIQSLVDDLSIQDYPELLKKDGVFKRVYIPTWLKKGVFMRDKGRCQICGTDLTKILTVEDSDNLDHIIPLENGGTNDPVNFQLACETCNKSKGARNSTYNSLGSRYWKMDEKK